LRLWANGQGLNLLKRSKDFMFYGISQVRSLNILPAEQRVQPGEFAKQFRHAKGTILLDVRSPTEFEICHLAEAKSSFFLLLFSLTKQEQFEV